MYIIDSILQNVVYIYYVYKELYILYSYIDTLMQLYIEMF